MKSACESSRYGFVHMKNLYMYTNILGMTPLYDYSKRSLIKSIKYDYFVFVKALFLILGSLMSLVGRIIYVYPGLPRTSLIITDSILLVVLTVSNVTSVILICFKFCNQLGEFLRLFFVFEDYKKFLKVKRRIRNSSCFYTELLILHVAIFVLFCYDAYTWISIVGWKIYLNYALRLVDHYCQYIYVEIFYNFVLVMRCNFQIINDTLREEFTSYENRTPILCSIIQNHKINYSRQFETIKIILYLYEISVNQISLFNSIFGWQILFLFTTLVFTLIDQINNMFVLGVLEEWSLRNSQSALKLFLLGFSWALITLVLGIMIVVACERTKNEAQQTSQIAYNISIKLPSISSKSNNDILKEKVTHLAQFPTYYSVSFSAAGFFSLNYSMILALFGSITSYVIVVVQFNK